MDVEGQFLRTAPRRTRRGLPLGYKVWLGVGALLALLACSIAVAVALIVGLRGHEQHLNERAVPFANAVASTALNAKAAANDQRGFLMTGDDRFVEEADRRIRATRASLAEAAGAASGRAQQDAIADARSGFNRWVTMVQQEFAGYSRGNPQALITAALGPDRAVRKSYEAALARAQTLGTQAIHSGDASVSAASSRSIVILLMYLLASLIIGAGVAYWLVRVIANPVAHLLAVLGQPG